MRTIPANRFARIALQIARATESPQSLVEQRRDVTQLVGRLCGYIPAAFGSLSEILMLVMGTNELRGSIPDALGSMLKVGRLDLASNSLSCRIPDALCSLMVVTTFDLFINLLRGSALSGLYHPYVYMCCGVIIWAMFGLLRCYYLGQACFLQNTVCQKHYKNRGFSTFFFVRKKLRAQI